MQPTRFTARFTVRIRSTSFTRYSGKSAELRRRAESNIRWFGYSFARLYR